MDTSQLAEKAQFIYDDLRMKTFPIMDPKNWTTS